MTTEMPTSEDLKNPAHLDALNSTATDSQLNAFAIDRLSQAFETSAKRWELIVYPTLFAFIILAAYGFYLIFSLAKDMHYLTVSVDTNMTTMANNVKMMSESVVLMSNNVRTMSGNVESMAQNVNTLEPMLVSIQNMDRSMQSMTLATTSMRNDLAVMNQNISRPMNFMNNMMPW
ncbi:hypothetical protein CKO12_04885 [Chromatium okenii]|nr:hypothetical protein [Chromatium okenii]